MMRSAIVLLLAAAAALAQLTGLGQWDRSISGTVLSMTNVPVARQVVSVRAAAPGAGREFTAETDLLGRFKVSHLLPGDYVLTVKGNDAVVPPILVKVAEDKDATGVVLILDAAAEISGTVMDRDKKPILSAPVTLLRNMYRFGHTDYEVMASAVSDLQGHYHLQRVAPGGSYILLARIPPRIFQAVSDEPADIDQRLPAIMPAYYMNSSYPEGALAITPQPGQKLEGMDIQIERVKAYCAEGVTEVDHAAASMYLDIEDDSNFITTRPPGVFAIRRAAKTARTDADGKFRICGLNRGDYRLRASVKGGAAGSAPTGDVPLAIFDKDVVNLRITEIPPVSLRGELVWAGDPPPDPVEVKAAVTLLSMRNGPSPSISRMAPGEFALDLLTPGQYAVQSVDVPTGYYAKDILYGGVGVLGREFEVNGSSSLRVAIAADGGTIAAKVSDSDGELVNMAGVWFLPAGASTPAELETVVKSCGTERGGVCQSATLRPGKYLVLATMERLAHSVADMDKLFAARSKGVEVELSAKGAAQVSLSPVTLF